MKRKYLTSTYLREATEYKLQLFLNEKDYYICTKKLINITEKFILADGTIGMDNGYYILEIVPKKEHYALRIFFDDKKNIIEYYFDIIKGSGFDEKYKIPYFDDLYLDIKLDDKKEITILDEDELEEAYKTNDITKEEYDLVLKTKDKLLKEIKNNTNKLLNMNYYKYINIE